MTILVVHKGIMYQDRTTVCDPGGSIRESVKYYIDPTNHFAIGFTGTLPGPKGKIEIANILEEHVRNYKLSGKYEFLILSKEEFEFMTNCGTSYILVLLNDLYIIYDDSNAPTVNALDIKHHKGSGGLFFYTLLDLGKSTEEALELVNNYNIGSGGSAIDKIDSKSLISFQEDLNG